MQFAQRLCNNPPPRNNGRYCTGKRAIYRSCNVTPCPPSSECDGLCTYTIKTFLFTFNIFNELFFLSQGKSYRQEQCELRNGPQTDPKGVKTFVEWVPKYAGVLPKDVCKLTCRAKGTGYYVVFSQRVRFNFFFFCHGAFNETQVKMILTVPPRQVVDGTECRPYSSSVCVKGKCIRTGCDGIIGSKLQFDKCGICGGDSTGCIRVVGNFTKKR